ncbi:hypothetical protein AX17_001467 [Amanita inopinata Kibby_2008]|nr:hypothetical protein AX17_001467 [Amanita inopinata Kibby_2008]
MKRDVLVSVLASALVSGFAGVIILFALCWALRRRQRVQRAELAYVSARETKAASPISWASASTQSIRPSGAPPAAHLHRPISAPMPAIDQDGKMLPLPPHISHLLNTRTKRSFPELPPLSYSTESTLRVSSIGPGSDNSDKQTCSRVPMLLRQPRRRSEQSDGSQRGADSVHSDASVYSAYSEASATASMHHSLPAPSISTPPPETPPPLPNTLKQLPEKETFVRRGRTVESGTTNTGASVDAHNQNVSFVVKTHTSEPALRIRRQTGTDLRRHVPRGYPMSPPKSATSPPPPLPPRSPMRSKSLSRL